MKKLIALCVSCFLCLNLSSQTFSLKEESEMGEKKVLIENLKQFGSYDITSCRQLSFEPEVLYTDANRRSYQHKASRIMVKLQDLETGKTRRLKTSLKTTSTFVHTDLTLLIAKVNQQVDEIINKSIRENQYNEILIRCTELLKSTS